jgi:hypothetical protein
MDKPMISTKKVSSVEHTCMDHYTLPTGVAPVGAANPILHIFLCEEDIFTVRPKTGLSPSSNYQAHYLSSQECQPVPFELVPGPVDDGRGGFWEIDRRLMPGLYGLQVPPYLRGPGYTYLYLCFAGARPQYLEIHGIEYDPYDSFALGLATWVRSNCHEHLTSGLRKSMPATLRPLLVDWLMRD